MKNKEYLNAIQTESLFKSMLDLFHSFADEIDVEMLTDNQVSRDKLFYLMVKHGDFDVAHASTLRRFGKVLLKENALYFSMHTDHEEYLLDKKRKSDPEEFDGEPHCCCCDCHEK